MPEPATAFDRVSRRRPAALELTAGLLAAAFLVGAAPAATPAPQVVESFTASGMEIDVSVQALGADRAPGPLREGDDALFRFRISDTSSGQPFSGAYPAAWMDHLVRTMETDARPCKQKIEELLRGGLFSQADVDLNVFYVLALNDDNTISVVDPRFHYGDSKLLTMVVLESPGEDWVLSNPGNRLFVTMPEVGRVAVADTRTWRVETNLEVGAGKPRRVALQPDGRYLWVTYPEATGGGAGGVAVFDATELRRVATIETGHGPHEMAFSDDSRWAFVTNRDDGTLSVVDVRTLAVAARLATGERPVSVAYSPLSRTVYVSNEGDGTIAVVDAVDHRLRGRIQAEPGLGEVRVVPNGRLGLVVNPERNLLHVFDTATGRIVQTADSIFGSRPDQIAFSDGLAYIRNRGSEIIVSTPLEALGQEGRPVSMMDISGGQAAFGAGVEPSPAVGMIQAPGDGSMLFANPADGAIYYYREGMAAPMGSFQDYGRQPRAVLVVDRSLKEKAPGSYETVGKLYEPGHYQLAFFLDSPQVIHCFDLAVEADPELTRKRLGGRVADVHYLVDEPSVPAGHTFPLRLRLTRLDDGQPVLGARDVQVMAYMPPGTREYRRPAREVGDGVYEAELYLGEPGSYRVYTQAPSLKLPFRATAPLGLDAVAPPAAAAAVPGAGTRGDP